MIPYEHIYSRDYGIWDPQAWLDRAKDAGDKHELRQEVYASTIQAVRRGGYSLADGTEVSILPDKTMCSGSRMYRRELHFDPPSQVYDTEFSVENEDCLVVAQKLVEAGSTDTAVLNLANRQKPGGGVYTGAGAQEESCFRRTDYYVSLYPFSDWAGVYGLPRSTQDSYPMDRDFGGCFSPNVTVFRGPEREGYPFLREPWKVNFIAVAAINRPKTYRDACGQERIVESLVPAAKNKIRTVLNIAIDNGMGCLVLGAMGCGAFKNPPAHMAQLMAQVLQEPPYRGRFRKIVFAVMGGGENYPAFCREFQ